MDIAPYHFYNDLYLTFLGLSVQLSSYSHCIFPEVRCICCDTQAAMENIICELQEMLPTRRGDSHVAAVRPPALVTRTGCRIARLNTEQS